MTGPPISRRIETIRSLRPDAAFRSNFIVGYPGETEEDHDALLDFVAEAQVDWCGFFAYSAETGTYAAGLDGVVERPLIEDRLAELREVQDGVTAARRDAVIGTEVTVLVDEAGVARSHREAPEIDGIINVPDSLAVGEFHRVRVLDAAGPDLTAEPVSGRGFLGVTDQATFGPSALMTPANLITVVRIALAPLAFWMIIEDTSSWALLILWFLITCSDGVDGYLARRQGATRSGAFLDPLADKVLALGGLWAMVLAGRFWWFPVVLITLREIIISAFRSYWGRRGLAVPASQVAKFKTVLQFGAVGWVTWPWFTDVTWLADGFLWAAVVVAWFSAVQYMMAGSRATSTMVAE